MLWIILLAINAGIHQSKYKWLVIRILRGPSLTNVCMNIPSAKGNITVVFKNPGPTYAQEQYNVV